jgi:hypothetical protein
MYYLPLFSWDIYYSFIYYLKHKIMKKNYFTKLGKLDSSWIIGIATIIGFLMMTIIPLNSCAKAENTKDNSSTEKVERITASDVTILNGYRYSILHVDGHEYLSNSNGGMIHLESCPCKKN